MYIIFARKRNIGTGQREIDRSQAVGSGEGLSSRAQVDTRFERKLRKIKMDLIKKKTLTQPD